MTADEWRERAKLLRPLPCNPMTTHADSTDRHLADLMELGADLCERMAAIEDRRNHRPARPRMWNTDESLPRGYYAVRTSLGLWDKVKFVAGGYQEIGGERMFYGPIPLPE